MGWGGGPMGGGGGGQPMFGGMRRAEGLPFAGIPPELQEGVDKILATEPVHPEEQVTFNRIAEDKRPFTLKRFFAPFKWPILGSFVFIILETVTGNVGPLLTGLGVQRSLKGQWTPLLVIAIAYFLCVVASTVTGRVRLAWTGRVGERLMMALR